MPSRRASVKISIQPSALADLRVGFRFYEKQQTGLGGYFLDSLYSDLIHFCFTQGFIVDILEAE